MVAIMISDITDLQTMSYSREMKKIISTYHNAREYSFNEEGAIVLPAILWWLGVPFTLLIILWFMGMF